MSKPLPDSRRDQIAADCADYGMAVFNALRIRDQAGRSAIDRLRDEASGELRAASYNGSGGGSVIPDPTGIAAADHVAHQRGNRDPETGRRMGRPDPTRQAEAKLERLDTLLQEMHTRFMEAQRILAEALPRPATASEADTTTLEEANKDAGCESCARVLEPSGARRYRATHRTGRVTAKSEAEEKGAEKRRRALLTGPEDDVDARARLAVDARLCKPCYQYVWRRLAPGANETMGKALPLSVVANRSTAA